MQTESVDKLAAAMAKAQGEIGGAVKDSDNPFFKSKYADLASVVAVIREPFAKNGLSFYQPYRNFDGELRIVTRIAHSSGEWLEDDGVPLLLSKQDMQGLGSASTYARRYGLMAAAGVAPEDDDGNAAVGKDRGPAKPVTVKTGVAKRGNGRQTIKIIAPDGPGEIPLPTSNDGDMEPIWQEWAKVLLRCIDRSTDVSEINYWIDQNATTLERLKAASGAAHAHIEKQAEIKRGILVQAPAEAAE